NRQAETLVSGEDLARCSQGRRRRLTPSAAHGESAPNRQFGQYQKPRPLTHGSLPRPNFGIGVGIILWTRKHWRRGSAPRYILPLRLGRSEFRVPRRSV